MSLTKNVTGLKRIRESLHPRVSQEAIARACGMSSLTYRRAEAGDRVRYDTAMSILNAINSELENRGLSTITLDDLGLDIH